MPTPDLSATLDDLDDLRRLVNVTDADWPLLLGWIVCAVIGAETPVLHLSGEAGTGKSTAATALVALLDPAHAVQRAAPVDDRDWSTQCASSAVLLLDNLDSFPAWLSNALCRTVTGAGYVTRRLYSDAGLTALAYRRAVVVTSIAAAPTRGDLADRMLTVELDRIAQRAPAGRMAERLRTAAPRIMGAVVKLAAVVAADLDDGRSVPNSPRLVEFSAVLAALDDLGGPWGTGALATFRRRSADGLAATADGHPVAIALRAMLHGRPAGWTGSASELLAELRRYRPPDDDPTVNRRVPWPTDATRLAGALRLLGPALEAAGVPIRNSRTATRRTYSIGTPVADDLDDLDDGTPVAPATLLDDLDDATPVAGDAGWIDDATTDDATTDDATPPPDDLDDATPVADDLDDATPVADDLDDLDAAGGRWDDPVAAPDDDPFGGL